MSEELKLSKDYFGFKGSFSMFIDQCEIHYADRLSNENIYSACKTNEIVQIITKNKLSDMKINDNDLFLAGYIWGNDGREKIILNSLKNAVIQKDFEFIRSINGQFSGGVVGNNSLFLFRNPLSQKNIFYLIKNSTLYFSTSFMDLVDGSIDFDEVALSSLCWGENVLPFKGIGILKEGEFLTFNENGLHIEVFDRLYFEEPFRGGKIDTLTAEFKELFSASVISKVSHYQSAGLMLSGGIDSGAIVGALSYKKYDLGRLYTYTWGSEKYTSCNDFKYVDKILQMHKFNNNYIEVGNFEHIDMLDMCSEIHFPSNHCLISWWMKAANIARYHNNACMISGLMADTLLDTNNLRPQVVGLNLRERLHLFFHGAGVPYYNYFKKAYFSQADTHFNGIDNRGIDIFTEKSKQNISTFLKSPYNVFNLQYLTLDHTVFYENEVIHFSPYIDRDVQIFANSLQDIFKRVPFQGKDISKPILRAGFLNELPREVCSRVSKSNFEEVIFKYVDMNRGKILSIFRDSNLVHLGIVDYDNLEKVFNNRDLLELNAGTILISGMIELWVDGIRKRRIHSYV